MKLVCSCVSRPLARVKLLFRGWCLPLLSLTKSPKGGHFEWMSACCDPFLDYCERSVWIVGLVSCEWSLIKLCACVLQVAEIVCGVSVYFPPPSSPSFSPPPPPPLIPGLFLGGDTRCVCCGIHILPFHGALHVEDAEWASVLGILHLWALPSHQHLLPLY